MLFKKKSSPAPLPSVRVLAGERVLYEGKLKDIPLKETVILEKSVHFFNDPEPCYIHRGAVRIRLTEELHQELLARTDGTPGPVFTEYADLEGADFCQLT